MKFTIWQSKVPNPGRETITTYEMSDGNMKVTKLGYTGLGILLVLKNIIFLPPKFYIARGTISQRINEMYQLINYWVFKYTVGFYPLVAKTSYFLYS